MATGKLHIPEFGTETFDDFKAIDAKLWRGMSTAVMETEGALKKLAESEWMSGLGFGGDASTRAATASVGSTLTFEDLDEAMKKMHEFTKGTPKPSSLFYTEEVIGQFVRKRVAALNDRGFAPLLTVKRGGFDLGMGDRMVATLQSGRQVALRRDHRYYIAATDYDVNRLENKFLLKGITSMNGFTAEKIEISSIEDLYGIFNGLEEICAPTKDSMVSVVHPESRQFRKVEGEGINGWFGAPQDWTNFLEAKKLERKEGKVEVPKVEVPRAPATSENWGAW